MRSQGKYFSSDELKRIITLLRDTDLTLSEIAGRMNCSRNAVAVINRRFDVRIYEGKRTNWGLKSANPPIVRDTLEKHSLAFVDEL